MSSGSGITYIPPWWNAAAAPLAQLLFWQTSIIHSTDSIHILWQLCTVLEAASYFLRISIAAPCARQENIAILFGLLGQWSRWILASKVQWQQCHDRRFWCWVSPTLITFLRLVPSLSQLHLQILFVSTMPWSEDILQLWLHPTREIAPLNGSLLTKEIEEHELPEYF